MRKILLLLIFIGILTSCSEDKDFENSPQIVGKWNWVESSGGIDGRTITPESSGEKIKIDFSSKTYRKYINGSIDTEMSYKIEKGKSIRETEKTDIIFYEDNTKQSFELIDNRLILYDECYDCFQHEYSKE